MFTEDQLLKLLKVQSNLGPADFEGLFGSNGRRLFNVFANQGWNLLDFTFNKVNGVDREVLIKFINEEIK